MDEKDKEIMDLGNEPDVSPFEIQKEKVDVNPYDIFRLAKWILIVAAVMYMTFGLIRIFYSGCSSDGVKEVWEYSKSFLNSIILLVLGLYFGSKEAKSKT